MGTRLPFSNMNNESELCPGTMMCCYKLTRTCDDFVLTSHSFNRCQSEEKHSIGISEILKQTHCPGHSPSSPTSGWRPRGRSSSKGKTPCKGDTGDAIAMMLACFVMAENRFCSQIVCNALGPTPVSNPREERSWPKHLG